MKHSPNLTRFPKIQSQSKRSEDCRDSRSVGLSMEQSKVHKDDVGDKAQRDVPNQPGKERVQKYAANVAIGVYRSSDSSHDLGNNHPIEEVHRRQQ